jgi:transcriptional regulator with XRE-family HTH domain
MTKLPPPTDLARQLGTMLQDQRLREGLTQSELAERAELSLKYVGEIERGEANVTIQALERLASVLRWDPWSLFAPEQQAMSEAPIKSWSRKSAMRAIDSRPFSIGYWR